jgi:hypothetical protein
MRKEIDGCRGGATYELGRAVTNPNFFNFY